MVLFLPPREKTAGCGEFKHILDKELKMELQIRLGEGKQVSTEIRGHRILTDQPVSAGGLDEAPSPYDLFLASIGTCAGYYIKAYCDSKGVDSTGIELSLAVKRDPESRAVTGFRTTITVPSTLPANLHTVLERVAAQCAVKKTVMAHPEFEMHTVVRPV